MENANDSQRAFPHGAKGWIVLWLFIASVLYGVSYQQFHFYSTQNDAKGLIDTISYIRMANGNYDVNPVIHRNRPMIPLLASLADKLAGAKSENVDTPTRPMLIGFYAVNFAFMFFAAFILFLILRHVGLSTAWAYVGLAMFLTSRVCVFTTATPLIDSAFFFAIALVVYLSLTQRFILLAAIAPLLILTKETILPFLLIPVILRFRWWTVLSFVVSVAASLALITFMGTLTTAAQGSAAGSFFGSIMAHVNIIGQHLCRWATPSGMHDIFLSFGFFLPLFVVGAIINRRTGTLKIPLFVKLILPLSIILALLSGNTGRMIFIAFPLVIPYAVLAIQSTAEKLARRE